MEGPPGSGSPGICPPGCPPRARWSWQGEAPRVFCPLTVPGPAWRPAGALGHCMDARNPGPSPSGQSRPVAQGQCPGHMEEKAGALVIAGVTSAVASVAAGGDTSSAGSCRRLRRAEGPRLSLRGLRAPGGPGHWSKVRNAGALQSSPGGNRGRPGSKDGPGKGSEPPPPTGLAGWVCRSSPPAQAAASGLHPEPHGQVES